MTDYVVDEAWTHTDPAATAQVAVAVCRYLSWDHTKNLSPQERDALHGAGLGIVLNWEAGATDALKGAGEGARDAAEALRQAAALGAPANVPIYYSVDTDAYPSQVTPYFQAVKAEHDKAGRPVGFYGGADVYHALHNAGLVSYGWITNASSWSHGASAPDAHLQQLTTHPIHIAGTGDNAFDVNVVLQPLFGQWGGKGAQPDMDPKLQWDLALFLGMLRGDANSAKAFGANLITDVHDITGAQVAAMLKLLTQVAAKVGAPVQVDVDALAEALHSALSAADAKAVADELAKRLAA